MATRSIDRSATEHVEFAEESFDVSEERFDRMAFAEEAIAKLRSPKTTVALCTSRSRVRIEMGRAWGRGPGARWAIVAVPPYASKHAIASAVATLASEDREPYVLDALFHDAASLTSA